MTGASVTEGYVLPRLEGEGYEEICRNFEWQMPRRFNIGVACTDAHPADNLAILAVDRAGNTEEYTFGRLSELSSRAANAFGGLGLEPGDRVAVALPPSPAAAVAHLGAFKAGMISLPLSRLFGVDALRHRLVDSGAKLIVTDTGELERLEELGDDLEGRLILLIDSGRVASGRIRSFWSALEDASDRLPEAAASGPEDPCMLIYTSGTTGPPKGVLHAHRVLIGQAPGFRLCHEMIPQPGDRMWTPADWAWIGGLVNTVLLAWLHGVPMVVAERGKFDPEWALDLMARHEVRNAFLPTTALRMMLRCRVPKNLRLRSMLAGGEEQEPWLLEATREAFGIPYNEGYGQTEADFVVGHCASRWPLRAGSMGRAYPGHTVTVAREDGEPAEPGEVGEVVIRAPDPTILLSYWNRPDATREKFRGEWLRTGDLARIDEEGYLWFESRADDVIKSGGYRIGPSEIEECLRQTEAVANAGVIGVPDEIRGHVVKAYIQLNPGFTPSDELEASLRDHVRKHLAAYQYPRLIEFVASLPMTATGKVSRSTLRERAAKSDPAGDKGNT